MTEIAFYEVVQARQHFLDLLKNYWFQSNFLTAKWWIIVILSLVPWAIWWYFLNKQRGVEIVCFGLMVSVISTILDSIGGNLLLWEYKIRVFYLIYPEFFPYDFTAIPIVYMAAYQLSLNRGFKRLLLYIILVSGINAFLFEPLMQSAGVYNPSGWKSIYSFIVYNVIAVTAYWILSKLKTNKLTSGLTIPLVAVHTNKKHNPSGHPDGPIAAAWL